MVVKTFTRQQLKEFDGKAGRPAYVAYRKKVYDVTGSAEWSNGEHQGMHGAGADLTGEIENAPHGEESFDGFEIIGELTED